MKTLRIRLTNEIFKKENFLVDDENISLKYGLNTIYPIILHLKNNILLDYAVVNPSLSNSDPVYKLLVMKYGKP